jgi:hypothetical protein
MDPQRRAKLERLLPRARRRLLRRKARAEAIWTAHIQKTGHQPSLWHSRYQLATLLEDEAHILVNWLGNLAGVTEVSHSSPLPQLPRPEAQQVGTLAVWQEGHYLSVQWRVADHTRRVPLLASFKEAFPQDRAYQPTTQSWCLHRSHLPDLRRWANTHFPPEHQDWTLDR